MMKTKGCSTKEVALLNPKLIFRRKSGGVYLQAHQMLYFPHKWHKEKITLTFCYSSLKRYSTHTSPVFEKEKNIAPTLLLPLAQ